MPKMFNLKGLFGLSIVKIVNHILHYVSKAATWQVSETGKKKTYAVFMFNDKFERIIIPIMLLFTF